MPEKTSIHTQVSQELGEAIAKGRAEAEKSKTIPFGMERVSADTETRRFMALGPEGKMAYLKANGPQKTLDLLKRGVKHA